ncbi:hypothetical protein HOP50_10g59460 [Chloropicon primus]|uniref:Ribosomal silencing factor RsfS n=1 Tax=Chloropicon primus TaxID=1764295 RepID=A0A5B8MSY9_9CHLO|nr:hypothetical protein A3770_10p59250 [Chloropicon primus]UPR02619.1 hypothetical protein HOP50_10g59460 [Chloropicon primus]|eukprot:QDZ23407.1 hypothetical protein A3770_10p59250 [Chloropicon primus]
MALLAALGTVRRAVTRQGGVASELARRLSTGTGPEDGIPAGCRGGPPGTVPDSQALSSVVDDVVDLIQRARGKDIAVVDLANANALCNSFIIATGTSRDHLGRITGGCQYLLKERGYTSRLEEGEEWYLLDGGSLIVHAFSRGARNYYDLEGLHANADSSNVRHIPNLEELD